MYVCHPRKFVLACDVDHTSLARKAAMGVSLRPEVAMSSISLPVLQSKVPFGGTTEDLGDFAARLVTHSTPRSAEARAQSLVNALDLLTCGAILLTTSGRVDRLNRSAEAYLGRGLVLVRDRLRAQVRDGDPALQQLITSAVSQAPLRPAQAVVALPRPERRPIIIQAARLAPGDGASFCAVLILLDGDKQRKPSEEVLRQAFGLTVCEGRLALAVAQGHEVKEIAAAYNICEGTVRSHLKAVFAKTGTRRQAELRACQEISA